MGRWGTEAPPPVPVCFAAATRCMGNLWFSSLFYTSPRSPPAHWTFSPSYLCQIARACLDCPIRVSAAQRHRVIPGQTTAELLPGQRSARLGHCLNISIQRFSLHDLSLQEGKRQIPLARLHNLLFVSVCVYIFKKAVTIKSCPKYQGGKVGVSSVAVNAVEDPVLLLPVRPESVPAPHQECKENASQWEQPN